MIDIRPEILKHIFDHLPLLLNRDFLLDVFTHSEKSKAKLNDDGTASALEECYLYSGKFLNINEVLYKVTSFEGVVKNFKGSFPVESFNFPANEALASDRSPILLSPGILANYTEEAPLQTTLGRLLLNYSILVDPFGDLIPYINELWNIGKIESGSIFEALRTEKISVEQVKHYSRNLYFIGHFTELTVPNFTEKSLTVDPAIIKRRDELLLQYAKEIAAGDVVVMSKIEQELIAMDKENLKGDPSTSFYDYDTKKSYGIHRKTMYLLGGISAGFDAEGDTKFLQSSLEDGWKVGDFAALCNQIRSGSYSRAKETAKGGEETKFLIRVFQNTQITEQDCKSEDYLSVKITKDNGEKFIYRNIFDDGNIVILSDENISSYHGKTVFMRSPQHCHTKEGFCYTCMGELFRTINADLLTMAAIEVSKTFVIAALKKAHGVSSKKIEVTSLNQYVI